MGQPRYGAIPGKSTGGMRADAGDVLFAGSAGKVDGARGVAAMLWGGQNKRHWLCVRRPGMGEAGHQHRPARRMAQQQPAVNRTGCRRNTIRQGRIRHR